ncbi:DUF6928 family protein [Glycomyces paridis]|uniref:Uncharacterized protein n=1 Tax=Glycomyces paridis TaxID=2126555 RepID=A0A4S8PGE9_9ACTN|nr:hypothetical protein [Glycomyces paridis]THV28442.1 hypothetical protein E9998_12645 [Glycomyces paridis]
MGSKSAVVYLGEGLPADALRALPEPDMERSTLLAAELLGGPVAALEPRPLSEAVWPERGTVVAGCFPGFDLVAHQDLALDRPSDLSAWIADLSPSGDAYGVFMHSVVDFGAFAVWEGGELRRSLSLSPDSGVMDDLGEHFPFEAPFWAGYRAMDHAPEYPLPFHPLDLGNEALASCFGFTVEGVPPVGGVDAEKLLVPAFRLAP